MATRYVQAGQSSSSTVGGQATGLTYLFRRILAAASRLETSTSISLSISRVRAWQPTTSDKFKWAIQATVALLALYIMEVPSFPLKLGIPGLYALAIMVPLTSQFFLPASPIFSWLITFYSASFIPPDTRPHIWVSVLPTLETVWYGASISDILTRFGHPALDIIAWIPYGVIHFAAPFVVAACLFVFGPPASVKNFALSFGFMNLIGVLMQLGIPCAPPWYELREGLTAANYAMKGSPAGLARIDALFHSHGYTLTFTNAPVPFGAFPSLHAGCATIEALFCSYFFPVAISLPMPFSKAGKRLLVDARILYWSYAFWLYWCTMYLMHHYLIDLVAGGCLATVCFHFFLSDDMRIAMEQHWAYSNSAAAPTSAAPSISRPASAFGTRRVPNASEDVRLDALGKPNGNVRRADVENQGGGSASDVLFDATDDEGSSAAATAGASAAQHLVAPNSSSRPTSPAPNMNRRTSTMAPSGKGVAGS